MPVYPTRDLPLRIMYHATEGIIKLHMVNKFMDNLPLCQEPNKSNLKINQIFSIKLYCPMMNKSVFKFRIML